MSPPKLSKGFDPQAGLTRTENIALEEIYEGNISERITKMLELLTDKNEGTSGYISVKLSLNFIEGPLTKEMQKNNVNAEETDVDDEVIVQNLQEALEKHLEKKKQIAGELSEKLKKLRASRPVEKKNGMEQQNLKFQAINQRKKHKRTESENFGVAENVKKQKFNKSNGNANQKRRHSKSESDIGKIEMNNSFNKSGSVENIQKVPNSKNQLSKKGKKKNEKPIFKESKDYLPLSL